MQKLGGSFLAPSIGFLGLLTLCPVNSLAGGAWVHEANKYYVETSFSYYQANEIFRSDGTRVPNRIVKDPTNPASVFAGLVDNTYRQYEGSLYLEYGLPYDLEFPQVSLFIEAVSRILISENLKLVESGIPSLA